MGRSEAIAELQQEIENKRGEMARLRASRGRGSKTKHAAARRMLPRIGALEMALEALRGGTTQPGATVAQIPAPATEKRCLCGHPNEAHVHEHGEQRIEGPCANCSCTEFYAVTEQERRALRGAA